jgi:geranylgeranyl reductase family protein
VRRDADAIVVGAGPGGSSAAFFLAERGRRVLLLDKRAFPRDKACGDGVTQPGVALLREMDVLDELADAQRYRGLRVHVTGRTTRDYRSSAANPDDGSPERGMVVPRLRLDDVLCRAAAGRGADLQEGAEVSDLLYSEGAVAGVVARVGDRRVELRAPAVVCADGATSGLGRRAGLVTTRRDTLGYAIRGYYEGIEELPSLLEFYLPIADPEEEHLLPSYGWIFPTGAGTANVGVGISYRAHGANVRRLFEAFLERLRESEPRFAASRQVGAWRGAPLRSDFAADRCAAAGVLLVGDAAGLVSPFTGEGISYALESGKLAAQTVDEGAAAGRASVAMPGYSSALSRRYGGYFETGREATRRYELAFRILESTFDDDRPLFALYRHNALLPEGAGVLRSSDLLEDIADRVRPLVARLRADLAAVDEVMVRMTQRDWPFLSRLAANIDRERAVPARPATLMLLASYTGAAAARDVAELAAAVELSFLAALSHAGLGDSPPVGEPRPGAADRAWSDLFALLTGNFQMAKALELTAGLGGEAIERVTTIVSALCEGRTRDLSRGRDPEVTPGEWVEIVAGTSGRFFESVCDLACWLAHSPAHEAAALRRFGRAFGVAYHLSEEVVNVAGRLTPMGPVAAADLERGRLNLPVVFALGERGALSRGLRALLADPGADRPEVEAALAEVTRSRAMESCLREIRAHARDAEAAAGSLEPGPLRDSLVEVANFPVDRAVAELERPDGARDGGGAGGQVVWALPARLGVEEDVERLREVLDGWARGVHAEVRELVDYQLGGAAKYYRPSTIFACHRAVASAPAPPEVMTAAAAVELFHNYTLVIDDVVDRDIYRRGKLALHRRFGRVSGVAAGAYLAFGAAELVADDEYVSRAFDALGRRVCVAESRQWRLRGQPGDVEAWRSIASEDTGAMFETCAVVATRDDRLRRFGSLLGTLYHGCDDVADVRGTAALGGGREKDITDRILTLPAALATRDPETARLFADGDDGANDELAARLAEVLPEADAVLDRIAREAEEEARAVAGTPQPLLELVRYTRALSDA